LEGLAHFHLAREKAYSQGGFALIWLLVGLPILMLLSFWLFASFDYLRGHSRLNQKCRELLLQAQEQNLKDIKRLLALNREVRLAWLNHDSAYADYLAALATGTAPVIAAAELVYRASQTAIRSLRIAQQFLINKAQLDRVIVLHRVRELIYSDQSLRLSHQKNQILWIYPGLFAVLEKPGSRPELPEYELQENFTHRQRISVIWRIKAELKEQVRAFGQAKTLRQDFSCGASIKSNGNQKVQDAIYYLEPHFSPFPQNSNWRDPPLGGERTRDKP
jgi:multidrug efflux pump subunit AcrA (membrane-fusion protein)